MKGMGKSGISHIDYTDKLFDQLYTLFTAGSTVKISIHSGDDIAIAVHTELDPAQFIIYLVAGNNTSDFFATETDKIRTS